MKTFIKRLASFFTAVIILLAHVLPAYADQNPEYAADLIDQLVSHKTELRISGGTQEEIDAINDRIEALGGEIMSTSEVQALLGEVCSYSFSVPVNGNGVEWTYHSWTSNGYTYDRLIASYDGTNSGELFTSDDYVESLSIDISSSVISLFTEIVGFSGSEYADLFTNAVDLIVSLYDYTLDGSLTGITHLSDVRSHTSLTGATDVSFIYVRSSDKDENERVLSLVSSKTFCSYIHTVNASPHATYHKTFWVSADNYNNSIAARNAYNSSQQPVYDFSTGVEISIAQDYTRTVYFPCPSVPANID